MALLNNDIFITSVEYIKKNSTLPDYLDEKYLKTSILEAQNIEMQSLLGTPLYTNVIAYERLYLTTGTTIPADYDELIVTYMKPAIMYCAIYRALTQIYMKIMNTSIVVQQDNTKSQKVEYTAIEELKRQYLQTAEWYCDMLTRYLLNQNGNHGKFPEYSSFSSDVSTILPRKSKGYGRTGIYFKSNARGPYYGPNNSFDFGTTQKGWNSERGSAREDICC